MLHGRVGLSPVLVGRDRELTTATRLVADTPVADSADRPPVAAVSGEAGVGKSRLLREVCARVDVQIFAASAQEGDDARPYGLLRAALEPVVSAWGDEVPAGLAAREHALRHVLHPLLSLSPHDHAEESAGASAGQHSDEEFQLAALALLRTAIGGGPALLVLEDLHWADAETVSLLPLLATAPGVPVAVIVSFRPEQFDRGQTLARVLPELERQRGLSHLKLDRLSPEELAAFIEGVYGRPAPSLTVRALHERTLGNPFFVEELIGGSGADSPERLPDAELPWNAAEAVLRRVDDLDAQTRAVLDAAAVLGARVDFDLLAAVTGRDEGDLLAQLRELERRGLLAESRPDELAFRHVLTREALESQLFERERRRLHEAALAELERAGSTDYVALARHAAAARRPELLARCAQHGGEDLLADGASAAALRLAELALDARADLDDGDEASLRELATRAAWRIGAVEEAELHGRAWRARAAAQGDVAGESRALRHLAQIRWFLADVEGQSELLAEALALARTLGDHTEQAWCLARLSQHHARAGDAEEALRWADAALDLADRAGAEEVVPSVLVNTGVVLTDTPGREDEGLARLEEARREAARLGQPTTMLRAYHNAIVCLLHEVPGRVEEARRLLAEDADHIRRHGHAIYEFELADHAAQLAAIDGDLAAAERAAAARPSRHAEVWQLARALLAAERGDTERARAVFERTLLLADDARSPTEGPVAPRDRAGHGGVAAGHESLIAGTLAASAADLLDDPAFAVRCLQFVLAHVGDRVPGDRGPAARFAGVVTSLARFPEVSDADLRRLFAEAEAAMREHQPVERAYLEAGRAALAERAGDQDATRAAGRRALERTDLPMPAFWYAEVRARIARAEDALGDREEARRQARLALAALESWPGVRRQRIAELGRRLGLRGVTGRGGEGERNGGADDVGEASLLTPREREVLRLVAAGSSNGEIAERLYISRKTAAVHVSNILRKTGTESRTQAAAWAYSRGVATGEPADV